MQAFIGRRVRLLIWLRKIHIKYMNLSPSWFWYKNWSKAFHTVSASFGSELEGRIYSLTLLGPTKYTTSILSSGLDGALESLLAVDITELEAYMGLSSQYIFLRFVRRVTLVLHLALAFISRFIWAKIKAAPFYMKTCGATVIYAISPFSPWTFLMDQHIHWLKVMKLISMSRDRHLIKSK